MRHVIYISMAAILLVGCGQTPTLGGKAPPVEEASGQIVRPVARPEGAREVVKPPQTARTVEQFDTTSTADRQAAQVEAEKATQSGAGKALGRTVASLGDPTKPGFWIETSLVSAPAKGRVVYPSNGKAVQVDLIPIDGPKTAGSRMSLAALRVIEAPLTDLPEVEVFRD